MRSHILMAAAGFLLGACSAITPSDMLLTPSEGEVVFTGTIQSINDAVPVDGGVIITLRSGTGESVTAYLQSFFRVPPPEQWEWDLYEVIRGLTPGQTVIVKGPMTDSGIRITGITRR